MISLHYFVSPAHLKAFFAKITASISFIIAAATIVPDTIDEREGAKEERVFVAIPVNIKDTPEWGSSVNLRYFVTVGSALVSFPPIYANPIFPIALDNIYMAVKRPAPEMSL